ncbi:MAG: DUF1329 domain-containing protein [Porticoccaceae bacterium]
MAWTTSVLFKAILFAGTVLVLTENSLAEDIAAFPFDEAGLRAASPSPGTAISSENITQYADIVEDVLESQIAKNLLTITVGETISFEPHAAYVAATKKFGTTTQLGAPGELSAYVAGKPFGALPAIDDPRSGEKLAWNMRYAYGGDSVVIPEMYWYYRNMRKDSVQRKLKFSAQSLKFAHRTVKEPLPSVEPNPYQVASAIYLKVHAPQDIADTQLVLFYNKVDTEPEQAWMYLPILRRVRRIATKAKTDSFLGSDIMIEDFLGYSGRIMDMNWKIIGESRVLLPFYEYSKQQHSNDKARKHDYKFIDFHGESHCYPKVTWQLRDAYILEGSTTRSDHPIGKRIFYVDKQTSVAPLTYIYDKAGDLWKIGIGGVSHPDYHVAENKGSGAPILDSSAMIDIQNRTCTTIQMITIVNNDKMRAKDFTPNNLR